MNSIVKDKILNNNLKQAPFSSIYITINECMQQIAWQIIRRTCWLRLNAIAIAKIYFLCHTKWWYAFGVD